MNVEEEKARRIIQKHKSDLENISGEIIKGASEGCKQGIAAVCLPHFFPAIISIDKNLK